MPVRDVPDEWMPSAQMQRVILHWTGGGYRASSLDREHYHILAEGDGTLVRGKHPISANQAPIRGPYAAHTLNCNGGSIGVSACCMLDARQSPFSPGPFPLTEQQAAAMAEVVAQLCHRYGIPVTPRTVLCHGEVERQLGIKQRAKWDPCVLPWNPGLPAHAVCAWWREQVTQAIRRMEAGYLQGIVVTLKGGQVEGFLEDGAAWVPVRETAAALGWSIASFALQDPHVVLAGPDGATHSLKASVFRDRLFVKARSLATVSGKSLIWDPDLRRVRFE